jgi:putative photosynthetic complex assembly protein 2
MTLYLGPVLFTLFVWWFSTGVILYLDGLPRRTFKVTMAVATFLLALALLGLYATRDDTRVTGAYLAFTCGVMVWAWQEIAFLLGVVTGSRRTPLPPGTVGWPRFRYALQAVLHHELALVVLFVAVLAATWGGENPVGLWTYVILWVMRQSAKLNVFLGVRNLNEGFLPPHLAYLQTYFRRAPSNALFPFSVIVATIVAMVVWQAAVAEGASAFDVVALTFAGTLLSLAVLEHWFLVLPLPSEQLWNWGLKSRQRGGHDSLRVAEPRPATIAIPSAVVRPPR